MKNKNRFILTTVLLASIFVSCAKVPNVTVWRPWTRTLQSESEILLNSQFSIHIEGNTKPLLGDESILQEKIEHNLIDLLKRRGYKIVDSNPDYNLLLKYRTERVMKSDININRSYSSSSLLIDSDNAASTATGVFIAALLSNSLSQQEAETTTSYGETGYFHTISLEIRNNTDKLIFKGESSWESEDIDLIYEIKPAIQMLICELPKNKYIRTHVNEVKKDKSAVFYKLYCSDKWYSCPALPNRIFFPPVTFYGVAKNVENPRALPAYLDLIQTAEYALPIGTDEYSDLLDSKLWSRVLLGGIYTLGPSKDEVNILIILEGQLDGYKVDRCWIASDEIFQRYENQMQEWKDALNEFYDLYL